MSQNVPLDEPSNLLEEELPNDGFDYMIAKMKGIYQAPTLPKKEDTQNIQREVVNSLLAQSSQELLRKYTNRSVSPDAKITCLAKIMCLKHNINLDDLLEAIKFLTPEDQLDLLKMSI